MILLVSEYGSYDSENETQEACIELNVFLHTMRTDFNVLSVLLNEICPIATRKRRE